MNIKFTPVLACACTALALVGCSSSKQYFTPEHASSYDAKAITSVKYNPFELKASGVYRFISEPDGKLTIINTQTNNKQIFNLNKQLASIAIKGNLAAAVDATNDVLLINLSDQSELFNKDFGPSMGIIAPLAAPSFSDNLVLIPTLDGKLVVLNYHTASLVRVINLGTKEAFNNVIYFYTSDDKMVALSSSKITTIVGDKSFNQQGSFKNAASDDRFIYVFNSVGDVIKLDFHLTEIARTNFEFANFGAAKLKDNMLYVLENSGKLIKLDASSLDTIAVYDFGSKLNANSRFEDDYLIINGKKYPLK